MIVDVKLVRLGRLHMAAVKLGGITVRGRSAEEPGDAVRNLFWRLAGQDEDDDARIAIELGLAGTDLDRQLALEDGGEAKAAV